MFLLLSSSCESYRISTLSAWRCFMRLRKSWRTWETKLCHSTRQGVSILWVYSQWWARIDQPPSVALTTSPCFQQLTVSSSAGFPGSRNRGHHEEGTSDGWSRRRRAEVSIPNETGWQSDNDSAQLNVPRLLIPSILYCHTCTLCLQTATEASIPDS